MNKCKNELNEQIFWVLIKAEVKSNSWMDPYCLEYRISDPQTNRNSESYLHIWHPTVAGFCDFTWRFFNDMRKCSLKNLNINAWNTFLYSAWTGMCKNTNGWQNSFWPLYHLVSSLSIIDGEGSFKTIMHSNCYKRKSTVRATIIIVAKCLQWARHYSICFMCNY